MKFYGYDKCGTCRKAQKWLEAHDVDFEKIDITQTPPPKATLRKALKAGYDLKALFNTSGQSYRQQNIKAKLPDLTQEQALDLLVADGKLIKRPIAVEGDTVTVGFKEETYERTWG